MASQLQRLTRIGIALSAEQDLNRLLERILEESRAITYADAGTLYTVDHEAKLLRFQIVQNETLAIHMGRAGGGRLELPPVPLTPVSVSGYVALTGQTVNIPDVYHAHGFDFRGPLQYDALTGYRSQSMLVAPIRDHEDTVVAVLQLINARNRDTGEVVPFRGARVDETLALASQAGVALTNARLVHDLKALLEGLIQVLATAIDEKSAYTAGHIRRVTRLSMLLAEAVNQAPEAELGGQRFSEDELEELRVAGMLHDIGKLVIPDHITNKATKLETVYDRIHEIRLRFSVIRRGMENAVLRRKLELLQAPGGAAAEALSALDGALEADLKALADDLLFLEALNSGGEWVNPARIERLEAIAARTYQDDEGSERPFLTPNELRNLSIQRGTLLPEELEVVRTHASVSVRLLNQIPFSGKLRNVPDIAGDHHEALNGSGYPRGKIGDDISLQSRILTIADIFDALTAVDRPYKKAYPPEVACGILREEAERGKLDPRLVDLFIRADCPARLREEPHGSGLLAGVPSLVREDPPPSTGAYLQQRERALI
jgi:HD-GYP domain-containing protein (c-di-GMP phosphodiesterase class II)